MKISPLRLKKNARNSRKMHFEYKGQKHTWAQGGRPPPLKSPKKATLPPIAIKNSKSTPWTFGLAHVWSKTNLKTQLSGSLKMSLSALKKTYIERHFL